MSHVEPRVASWLELVTELLTSAVTAGDLPRTVVGAAVLVTFARAPDTGSPGGVAVLVTPDGTVRHCYVPTPPAACLAGGVAELTARERAILPLLAEGLTAVAIAHRLEVSPRTVHKHLENVYRKLGVSDRLRAVLVAREAGLLAS